MSNFHSSVEIRTTASQSHIVAHMNEILVSTEGLKAIAEISAVT